MTPQPLVQVYLTTEDGEYYDLRISDGNVSFNVWDMHENDINRFIDDIKSFVYLLKEEHEKND
jgi:hypothetical protein